MRDAERVGVKGGGRSKRRRQQSEGSREVMILPGLG